MNAAARWEACSWTEKQIHLLRVIYVGTLFSFIVLPETLQTMGPGETTMTFLDAILTQ